MGRRKGAKNIKVSELADILSVAEHAGKAEASQRFGVSQDAIRLAEKRLKEGQIPEVSAIIKARQVDLENARDSVSTELACTLSAYLIELRERLPKMSSEQVLMVTEKLGDLEMGRKYVAGTSANEAEKAGQAPGAVQVQINNGPAGPGQTTVSADRKDFEE